MRFAAAHRISNINQGFYRTFVSPWVKAMSTEQSAAWLRDTNPYRLRFELFSDKNPLMAPVAALAERARAERQTVPPDNALARVQAQVSEQIARGRSTAYGEACDRMTEATFFAIYGSPWLQAMVGLSSDWRSPASGSAAILPASRSSGVRSRRSAPGAPKAACRRQRSGRCCGSGVLPPALTSVPSRRCGSRGRRRRRCRRRCRCRRSSSSSASRRRSCRFIGIGIGIGGASAPVFIKERLAGRPASATGIHVTAIIFGSVVVSAAAVPLTLALGSWRWPLALASVATLLAALGWVILAGRVGPARGAPHRRGAPWRRPTAWLLIVVFCGQSLLFFGLATWLPAAYVERGWAEAEAANLVAVLILFGLPASLGVGWLSDRLAPAACTSSGAPRSP